jgi:hypothetical protein
MAFPDHPGNFTKFDNIHAHAKRRMEIFAEGRQPIYYDEKLQQAHHVHVQSSRDEVRFLQHFYGM